MNEERFHPPLRWVSFVVLALMAVAVVYAGYISIVHWSGIAV